MKVDLALVNKYSVPGPRYTSYPPATHFTDKITFDSLRELIRANNETERDLSLYFHLPFCYSLCWYCGCTTVITPQQGQSATYLGYLKKELDFMGPWLNPRRKVVQIHFGGGSPSFLLPDEIRRLGELIHTRFNVAADVEASIEIDPRRMDRDHVKAMREAGFNRASLGVQDNDPKVQKAVHRIQPRELTEQVAGWLREEQFHSLNIDLIYGLPFQTPEHFARTLDETLLLNPDRFAIFNYAHVPWIKPHQKIFKDDTLPTPEIKLQLFKTALEKLTSAGFVYIGMDHFARTTDELAVAQRRKTLQRNFQGYSTRGGTDIYAFGMSSISQAEGIYWQNHKDLPVYYSLLDEGKSPQAKGFILSADDRIRRRTIMRLMCDLGLDYPAMSRALDLDFPQYFAKELASLTDLEADGLLQRSAEGFAVSELGRLFIRNIAMRFDAYLAQEKEKRYSKTL
ncbi:MAG: oxygen-independent coproporphyrinogen III oxidase [Verrucomicrobia bacterium]|nr:oxygen-independent coproporphyrinogen III oxidase [Verrucomicrobiota bacterium]